MQREEIEARLVHIENVLDKSQVASEQKVAVSQTRGEEQIRHACEKMVHDVKEEVKRATEQCNEARAAAALEVRF